MAQDFVEVLDADSTNVSATATTATTLYSFEVEACT